MNVIRAKFEARAAKADTLLCVGLDPEVERMPDRFRHEPEPLFAFCRYVIDQTAEFAVAFKPNSAFFEASGSAGFEELQRTLDYLHRQHPDIVSIYDAKRGDNGNTNRGYVIAAFDTLGCDAVTLHPYLGAEALAPFLARTDKACVLLCRTSNAGAGELQDLLVADADGVARPLWQVVAEKVTRDWDTDGNCMLVVGATYPEEMRQVRAIAPETLFLVPGLGAQGGDLDAVVEAGLDARGGGLALASSRAILYAESPRDAAREQRDAIRAAVARVREGRQRG